VSNICNIADVARLLPSKRIYVIETGYPCVLRVDGFR
jgi:hypothetical protein